MPIDIAVIPVAGRGTRLLPLTKSQPKEMLPVGRKPVVQYVVEELADCGMRRLLFITGPGKTAIENHFDIDVELIENLRTTGKEDLLQDLAFERQDIEYLYTRQRRQLGLGHAVLCARPVVQDRPFVVALGDSIISNGGTSKILSRMVDEFENSGADAVIAFEEVPRTDVVRYGIAKPRGNAGGVFELADVVEKPAVDEAPSCLAVAARYVCGSRVLDYLKATGADHRGEIQFTDAFRGLIADGGRVLGMRMSEGEHRFDIGNFESYFRAFTEHALADPEYGPALEPFLAALLNRRGTK